MIELVAGDWRVRLRPEIGGAIAALDHAGTPVLRAMPETASDILAAACFAMVPYANRIGGGRFVWRGKTVELPPTLEGVRHALHGHGWQAVWRVVRHDRTSALLEHAHDGTSGWPWAYRAHQHVALDEGGCTVRLMVENLADEPTPLGLGLHPYVRRRAETSIRFEAEAMLGIDDDALPDGTSYAPDHLALWSRGALMPSVLVDNCFPGWRGSAVIADDLGTITLRGFGAPHLHVYAPPGEHVLCIEPVSHLPDALNRDPGTMPVVQPGCTAAIAMRIEARPR